MEGNYIMNYENAVQNVLDYMVKDYARWSSGKDTPLPTYVIESGRSYDKIVKICGYNQSQSCAGFICRKDNPKKGFKIGDLLMSAGWSAPATNFTRGNIFEDNALNRVRWTGVL
jgi:hypothetical protein